jgi:UDP-GlcNAc:undecaprenyl-phosphate GlcNAc-1-phosphate transferase
MVFYNGIELTSFQFTCLAVASSLIAGTVAYLLAGPARRIGLVSRHRRDRFGTGTIPLVGGPALAAGAFGALLALGLPLTVGQAVAVAGFFLVGLLDDLTELRPAPKVALQLGVALASALLLVPSLAFTGFVLVALLVLVNASNYLDNMDGLLPGVAITQAVALLLLGPFACAGAPLIVWAMPAVLFLALPPARIYLGDSGSHLVGALLALDAVAYLIGAEGVRTRFLLPLVVLFAVPLADAATVTVSRLRRGRPVFRGGTDHLSHRLVRAGFTVPQAVLALVLASGVCGVASLLLAYFS